MLSLSSGVLAFAVATMVLVAKGFGAMIAPLALTHLLATSL
jgi:hypothetical protein